MRKRNGSNAQEEWQRSASCCNQAFSLSALHACACRCRAPIIMIQVPFRCSPRPYHHHHQQQQQHPHTRAGASVCTGCDSPGRRDEVGVVAEDGGRGEPRGHALMADASACVMCRLYLYRLRGDLDCRAPS